MSGNINELATQRRADTIAFSVGIGILTLILAPVAGGLAMGLGLSFQTITLAGIFAGGLVIVFAWLSYREDARWMVVETVARELQAREAETELMGTGKATINHTQIDARGMGNAVEVNQGEVEKIRLIQVRTAGKLIDGIPAPALAFFIDQYDVRGWSQRAWIDQGIRLPGMKEPVDYDTWRQLVSILEKVEAIPPVKERSKIKPILPLETIKQKALGSGLTDATG